MVNKEDILKARLIADVQISNFRKQINTLTQTAERQHEEFMKWLTLCEEEIEE